MLSVPVSTQVYRGILADVNVYILAHLHRALCTEGKVLDIIDSKQLKS